jgi:hypothetical protein
MKYRFIPLLLFLMPADVIAAESCLSQMWKESAPSESDRAFDILHDLPKGGISSISCWAFTTPSALRNSVNNIQSAIRANDPQRLANELLFPLVINGPNEKSLIMIGPH